MRFGEEKNNVAISLWYEFCKNVTKLGIFLQKYPSIILKTQTKMIPILWSIKQYKSE